MWFRNELSSLAEVSLYRETVWHLKVKNVLVESVCFVIWCTVVSLSLSSPCYTAMPAGCRSKFHWRDSTRFTAVSPPFPADPLSITQAEASQTLSVLLVIISHREGYNGAPIPPAPSCVEQRPQRRDASSNRASGQLRLCLFFFSLPILVSLSSRTILQATKRVILLQFR